MKWTFSRRRSRRSSGRAWPSVAGPHSTDLSGTRRRPRCLNERDLREARKPLPRAVPASPEGRDVPEAEGERPKTESSQAGGSTLESPKPEDRRDRAAVAVTPDTARAGGAEETAVAAPPAAPPAAPLKLTFRAIDGYGSSPALLSGEPRDLPVDERGREYILLLDSQGIVRRVTPQPNGRGTSVRQGDASTALARLRFAPGSRPRRLLIRFE